MNSIIQSIKLHSVNVHVCLYRTLSSFIVFCVGGSKGSIVLELPCCLKLVVIDLWLGSYRTLDH